MVNYHSNIQKHTEVHKMKKRIISIVLAALVLLTVVAFAACNKQTDTPNPPQTGDEGTSAAPEANSDLEDVQNAGKLVIGITYFSPMNYFDNDGNLIGFETEFATAVCDKLGVAPDFKEIEWERKLLELGSKNIDCIWNGMTRTDDLAKQIDFSVSYMANKQVCVINTKNADTYTDLASMSGAAVVAEAGSAGETAALADSNLSQNYVSLSAQSDGLKEVKAGTADIAVLDAVMAYSMVGEGTDFSDLTVLDVFDESADEEYAIGYRQGSSLTEAINNAIAELVADGTLTQIAEKYGLESRILL